MKGASSRYRTYQYLPFLRENNINCKVSYLFGDSYLKALYSKSKLRFAFAFFSYLKRFFLIFKSFQYDLIIIEYELFPYFPAIFERILRFLGKKYLVDYDDAVFHNYNLNKNLLIRSLLKNKIKNVIKNADSVIAGSDYIFNYAKNYKTSIHKIPTVINADLYQKTTTVSNNSFIIGWIGSPTTSQYLLELVEVFKKLQNLPVSYKFIGTDIQIREHFNGLPVNWIDWSVESEIEEIKSFSVGIMPLDDTPWSRGKCGFKLIQYMACSIPVLASAVGENTVIVEHSKNGYLAKNKEEWYFYLHKMFEEKERLIQMGEYGRNLVERKYSLKNTSKQLIEIIMNKR